jgi:hypothetical protein
MMPIRNCRRLLRLSLSAAVLSLLSLGAASVAFGSSAPENKPAAVSPANDATLPAAPQQDGLHDFDFLIGDWTAHLKKRLHPLSGSNDWVEYDGTSSTRKIWDDRANAEEFDVDSPVHHLHIRGQTLRLYNPDSHQWSLYLVYAAKGQLPMPPMVGQFTDGHGEFYDQEEFDGRMIFVRYYWTSISSTAAQMVQSFSADGGKSWEPNWIVDLSRPKP